MGGMARRRQQESFAGKRNVTCNARTGTRELMAFCSLDEATLKLLKMAMNELKLSARCLRPDVESGPDDCGSRKLGKDYRRSHL